MPDEARLRRHSIARIFIVFILARRGSSGTVKPRRLGKAWTDEAQQGIRNTRLIGAWHGVAWWAGYGAARHSKETF